MSLLQLSFESGEDSLSVRHFSVREGLSELFDVSVWARSPNDDLDLDALIGRGAALAVQGGLAHALGGRRRWAGVCRHVQQVESESSGLSGYQIVIAPALWLLTQRKNNRLFQRKRIPDIVDALLAEWGIVAEWRLRRADYPRLELRVQYRETDFAFFERLLEEAGITFFFADHEEQASRLVLTDAPEAAEPRFGGPLPYVDNPNLAAEREYVSRVRVAREVRPGRVTLRDHDFRRSPEYELFGAPPALGAKGIEDRLEVYRYQPGASLVELEDAPQAQPSQAEPPPQEPRQEPEPPKKPQGKVEKALSGMLDKAVDKLVARAGSLAGSKVDAFVDKRLARLGPIGDMLGDKAGDLAGSVATKLAQKIATALRPPSDTQPGDDRGVVRHDDKAALRRSRVELESVRSTAFVVEMTTNVIDLAPGTVFSMTNHPRADLAFDRRLVITRLAIDGGQGEEWSTTATAAFARFPWRPRIETPKPVMHGVQSAIVVGPKGEEIHTDEHGRVRVQFHWDREGGRDELSSCWMRVSQGWAGAGYGMITIPRVGQEVLVAFLEGDPDLPLVVGTVFSGTARAPHALPDHKTRSSWRGRSSPGGNGANEIMMDDAAGRELVYLLAERDMQQVVKHDRGSVVGRSDATLVGESWAVHVTQPAVPPPSIEPTGGIIVDRLITFTTGEASITLDGPDIRIEAKGKIVIRSEGDDVVLRGGPRLLLNPSPAAPAAPGPKGGAPPAEGSGAAPATPPTVRTGLGDKVDAIASKSPTLKAKIEDLQAKGWQIGYGEAGKGSYADRSAKKIVIDSNYKEWDTVTAQVLAHEAGHATYTPDPYVPPDGLTRQQYVDRNVMSSLKDEGEATLTNIQIRNEIKFAGGPDIAVNGSQSRQYQEIYAKYPLAADRDRARAEIGELFATGETPSTATGGNYRQYYAKTYEDFYDANPPSK